jgi:hypothetical protein
LMLVSQVGVIQWRARHPKSYNLATLLALWVFPVIMLFSHGVGSAFRAPFLYAWVLFSALMAALLSAVHARTLAEATPGVVYGILEFIYLQCMGVASGVLTACSMLFFLPPLAQALPETALSVLVFGGAYAVYFAVIVRDMTGVISDVLVARVSAARRGGAPAGGGGSAQPDAAALRDACALCAGKLAIVDEGSVVEEGGDAREAAARPRFVRRADGTIMLVGGPAAAAKAAAAAAARAPSAPPAPPAAVRFASADGKTLMFQLTCKHVFHRTCLAGWAIVGKKGVCPVCSERVDLSVIYADSPLLGKTSAVFGQLLEMARYLVVWNPLLFLGLRIVLRMSGTLDVIEKHASAIKERQLDIEAANRAALMASLEQPPPA